jgi:hypothetical protein
LYVCALKILVLLCLCSFPLSQKALTFGLCLFNQRDLLPSSEIVSLAGCPFYSFTGYLAWKMIQPAQTI